MAVTLIVTYGFAYLSYVPPRTWGSLWSLGWPPCGREGLDGRFRSYVPFRTPFTLLGGLIFSNLWRPLWPFSSWHESPVRPDRALHLPFVLTCHANLDVHEVSCILLSDMYLVLFEVDVHTHLYIVDW